MKLTTLETAEQVPFKLNGRRMFTNDKVELVHLTLKPNEEIGLHANPVDVVFFILEGTGTVYFEELAYPVKANSSVFIEKDKQRGMKNTGVGDFRVLVVKIFV